MNSDYSSVSKCLTVRLFFAQPHKPGAARICMHATKPRAHEIVTLQNWAWRCKCMRKKNKINQEQKEVRENVQWLLRRSWFIYYKVTWYEIRESIRNINVRKKKQYRYFISNKIKKRSRVWRLKQYLWHSLISIHLHNKTIIKYLK